MSNDMKSEYEIFEVKKLRTAEGKSSRQTIDLDKDDTYFWNFNKSKKISVRWRYKEDNRKQLLRESHLNHNFSFTNVKHFLRLHFFFLQILVVGRSIKTGTRKNKNRFEAVWHYV